MDKSKFQGKVEYDEKNRPIFIDDGINKIRFEYKDDGTLHTVDENGFEADIFYDEKDKLHTVTDSNGNISKYDENGKLLYAYDKELGIKAWFGPKEEISYEIYEDGLQNWYDDNGTPLFSKLVNGTEVWYDEFGRMIKLENKELNILRNYTYDEDSNTFVVEDNQGNSVRISPEDIYKENIEEVEE